MARQGCDLQLTRYDEKAGGQRFTPRGIEHSRTSATGTGWEQMTWRAAQGAAWRALTKASLDG